SSRRDDFARTARAVYSRFDDDSRAFPHIAGQRRDVAVALDGSIGRDEAADRRLANASATRAETAVHLTALLDHFTVEALKARLNTVSSALREHEVRVVELTRVLEEERTIIGRLNDDIDGQRRALAEERAMIVRLNRDIDGQRREIEAFRTSKS